MKNIQTIDHCTREVLFHLTSIVRDRLKKAEKRVQNTESSITEMNETKFPFIARNIESLSGKISTNDTKISELSRYDNELSNRINTVNKKVEDIEKSLINTIYPVGSVITSASSSFNPNTVYSGTTWVQIKGRVIVGVDSSDSDFSVSGKTGGAKSFNNSHSHNTKDHTLTIPQIPAHGHAQNVGTSFGGSTSVNHDYNGWVSNGNVVLQGIYTGNTGENKPHNHGTTYSSQGTQSLLQPYITKYVWERTR